MAWYYSLHEERSAAEKDTTTHKRASNEVEIQFWRRLKAGDEQLMDDANKHGTMENPLNSRNTYLTPSTTYLDDRNLLDRDLIPVVLVPLGMHSPRWEHETNSSNFI